MAVKKHVRARIRGGRRWPTCLTMDNPVLAIASLTPSHRAGNGRRHAVRGLADRDRALSAAAGRHRGRRPVRTGGDEGAGTRWTCRCRRRRRISHKSTPIMISSCAILGGHRRRQRRRRRCSPTSRFGGVTLANAARRGPRQRRRSAVCSRRMLLDTVHRSVCPIVVPLARRWATVSARLGRRRDHADRVCVGREPDRADRPALASDYIRDADCSFRWFAGSLKIYDHCHAALRDLRNDHRDHSARRLDADDAGAAHEGAATRRRRGGWRPRRSLRRSSRGCSRISSSTR